VTQDDSKKSEERPAEDQPEAKPSEPEDRNDRAAPERAQGEDRDEEQATADAADADAADAEATDGDAGSNAAARKERVLHTRVSALLEQELKRLAASLRLPVSNVVRGILEEAVTTLDQVEQRAEGELRSVADRLERHREELRSSARDKMARAVASAKKARRGRAGDDEPPASKEPASQASPDSPTAPLEGVVGFQPLLLARAGRCSLCGLELAAGDQAYLGIHESGARRVIIGAECLPVSAKSNQPEE